MKSCLLVDDSPVIRKVTRRIFEKIGYQCDEAANGKIAMDACRAKMPDFILLEWDMPEMSGLEVLRSVRAEPNGPQPVIVFCTRQNTLDRIQEALSAGVDEYIMKPFDYEIVFDKLRQLGLIDETAFAAAGSQP